MNELERALRMQRIAEDLDWLSRELEALRNPRPRYVAGPPPPVRCATLDELLADAARSHVARLTALALATHRDMVRG